MPYLRQNAEGTIAFKKLDITNTVEEATAQKPVQVHSLITDIDHFNKTVVVNLEQRLNKGLGSAE